MAESIMVTFWEGTDYEEAYFCQGSPWPNDQGLGKCGKPREQEVEGGEQEKQEHEQDQGKTWVDERKEEGQKKDQHWEKWEQSEGGVV